MATRRSGSGFSGPTLFEAAADRRMREAPLGSEGAAPLAERMRPRSLGHIAGQRHLLQPGKLLYEAVVGDRVPSMILWGPPGCGKTTLARVIAESTRATFVPYTAVAGSVPELRQILARAAEARAFRGEKTLLFVDEIHRFHRGQQDALLPDVEKGTVVLIGATTENPSFAVNAALLSRTRVFHLEAIGAPDLVPVLRRALTDTAQGLGARGLEAADDVLLAIAEASSGDARRALGTLEVAASFARSGAAGEPNVLSAAHVEAATAHRPLLYDKSGEEHYNVVSAFIKSLRGSDPDAAIYWLFRMLEAGEDPLFVARRMVIFASEDIGNADPRALSVAVDADVAFRRLGMPEGAYPLSHACLYLASAPKSDSVKIAIGRAKALVARHGPLPVPRKLRNAPTKLMKEDGYGEGYRYAHDYEGHVVPGETYLPDELADRGLQIYAPTDQGLERAIGDRLARLRGASGSAPTPAPSRSPGPSPAPPPPASAAGSVAAASLEAVEPAPPSPGPAGDGHD
jgi:putative ATPase